MTFVFLCVEMCQKEKCMGPLLPGAMITSQNLGNFHVSINSPLDQKHIMSYQPVPKWPSQLWAVCLVSCSLSTYFFFFSFKFFLLFLNFTNCISFAKYQNESATGIHVVPILNPPPSSLPMPSLWVVPVHQPQASSIVHRTWTGNSFLT